MGYKQFAIPLVSILSLNHENYYIKSKGINISHSNIIKLFKICSIFLSLSLMIMIFFVSTNSDFETTSLVETKDFNIGSERDIFLVDNAKLSGSNKLGNSFNITANKINQIDNKLPIISGNKITGDINISSQILIQIKAKTADLNTKKNILKLYGGFQIINEKYKIFGKEIFFNFKDSMITSNKPLTFLFSKGKIDGGKVKIINSENKENGLLFLIMDGVKIKYLL